jgi:hypothetical protein
MSPVLRNGSKKITAADNLYTVVLAVAFLVVLATAAFVAYQCYSQYGTIFKIQ